MLESQGSIDLSDCGRRKCCNCLYVSICQNESLNTFDLNQPLAYCVVILPRMSERTYTNQKSGFVHRLRMRERPISIRCVHLTDATGEHFRHSLRSKENRAKKLTSSKQIFLRAGGCVITQKVC